MQPNEESLLGRDCLERGVQNAVISAIVYIGYLYLRIHILTFSYPYKVLEADFGYGHIEPSSSWQVFFAL